MNRNSPVPLWAVLGISVVLVGGIYVFAQRTIAPQASVIVRRPMASPQPIVSVTAAPSVALVARSSTVTPPPSAIAEPVPNGWLTYRNTKYGYEIKYPPDWRVTAPGGGEARSATGTDAQFSIVSGLPNVGVYFLLYILGSDDIGDYYRPARNLDQYLQLLTAGSSSSIHFVNEFTIDGRKAVRYEVPIFKDATPSAPAIFLQNDNYVLEIMDYYVEETVFENILSSIHFIGRTH